MSIGDTEMEAQDETSPTLPITDTELRECIVSIHRKVNGIRAEVRACHGDIGAMRVALIGNEFVGGALARLSKEEERNNAQDVRIEAHDRKLWQWGTIASVAGTVAGFLISIIKDWWHK